MLTLRDCERYNLRAIQKKKNWGKFKVDIFKKENDNETKKHRILNTRFNETFMGAKAADEKKQN